MKSMAKTPYKTLIAHNDALISKDEQQKLYILTQLSKIQENTARNILRKAFAKLVLKTIS